MRPFSTICTWCVCISLSIAAACTSSRPYESGPEGMQWRLLAYHGLGDPLDSAEIIYLDAVVLSSAGDTLAEYANEGFMSVEDSLWVWLKTRNVGDSLEVRRFSPDFLHPATAPGDTSIYHIYIDRMRSARELADSKTAEWLYLDSLIRSDSIRNLYREVDGIYLRVLDPGDTTRPVELGKEVIIDYLGSLPDGRVIDDSQLAHGPLSFVFGTEGQVVSGLEIALGELSKGAVARLIIPSRLAFGDGVSVRGAVPPHSTVLYRIRVVDVGK